jgi:hypothetical protein
MKDGRLHLRLSNSLLKRLRKMAKDCQLSVSELVTSRMELEVTRHEEGKALIKDVEQV